MMQEYLRTKEQYKDCLLFYRLGDFYEMFFDDAKTAARELELTLTGKSCGLKERAPMCGIPYHAVDIYIAKLVEKGYKVAVCEQMEDPKLAKGLVKRAVIRIVTPGTNTSPETLDEHRNNYLLSVFYDTNLCGIAAADVSTGDFYTTEVCGNRKILDEIMKYAPAEIIGQRECTETLLSHFRVSSMIALGIEDLRYAQTASGALLQYLYATQLNDLANITRLEAYASGKYMLLDSATRRNLELTETMREKKVRGSLLWVLDKTKTAMGARLLHQFLEQPLIDREMIEKRQDAVAALSENPVDRDEIREYLQPVYDLERLLTKISYGSANPKDVLAFRESLKMLGPIRQVLSSFRESELTAVSSALGDYTDLIRLLDAAIVDDPPLAMKDGGIIKTGYNKDIDHFREAKTQGKQWLASLEEEAREQTGIKTLRVKYNNVFGYFLEVTNAFKDQVPADWDRKQTLVGAERYTTKRLKELEDTILNAQDKLGDLEYEEFCKGRSS